MKLLFKKKFLIPLAIITVAIVAIFFKFKSVPSPEYITAQIEYGDLVQTVSETGTVKASKEIELNFLQSGKINKIRTSIGSQVKEGDVLAELDYASLEIKKQEAEASLEIARANLNKLLQGATRSEIAVSETNAIKAEAAHSSALEELEKVKKTVAENISQAQKTLEDFLSDEVDNITPYEQAVITAQINLDNTKATYQKSIDDYTNALMITVDSKLSAANIALDNINTVLTDDDIADYLSVKNLTYKKYTEDYYVVAKEKYFFAREQFDAVKLNQTDKNIENMINSLTECLNETLESLNNCYIAFENSVTSAQFTQSELDAYKTTISTQITNINSAISSIQTADQNLSSAKLSYSTNVNSKEDSLKKAEVDLNNAILNARNSLSSAQTSGDQQITGASSQVSAAKQAWDFAVAQLTELKSPPRNEDVSLSRAQVKQAEASLNLISKQIDDSLIKAPIDGTITSIGYEEGEQTGAAKPVIKMLGENNFEIEVDISEADIAKISPSNPVTITLDAFGDEIKFSGEVYFIEPAETVIQEVIYYKVKIIFDEEEIKNNNIKSGMTANVVIITNSKENVLLAPNRAIIEKNGSGKYIRRLQNDNLEEIPVKIGLKGDEGLVEILDGLKAGDTVVTYIKELK